MECVPVQMSMKIEDDTTGRTESLLARSGATLTRLAHPPII